MDKKLYFQRIQKKSFSRISAKFIFHTFNKQKSVQENKSIQKNIYYCFAMEILLQLSNFQVGLLQNINYIDCSK